MTSVTSAVSASEGAVFIVFLIALSFWLFVMSLLVRRIFAYRRSPK
jgi:hypothetical protein